MARAPRWLVSAGRIAVAGGALAGSVLAGACSAVSPPPLIPMHAGTAPHALDETTVTVVVGVAGELFGGEGWGVALRGEQQVEGGTALGLQLGGGRGDEGDTDHGRPMRHWLVELRGYGRVVSPDRDWLAGLASLGVTGMDTGLVATTLALGAAVSYPNGEAVPAFGLFAAVSKPWRRGAGFGAAHDKYVHTTWWLGASAGLAAPLGASGNVPSVEAGLAWGGGREHATQISASFADSHSF